jgi:hypothetical protein
MYIFINLLETRYYQGRFTEINSTSFPQITVHPSIAAAIFKNVFHSDCSLVIFLFSQIPKFFLFIFSFNVRLRGLATPNTKPTDYYRKPAIAGGF